MLNLPVTNVNIAPKQFTGLSQKATPKSVFHSMAYHDSLLKKSIISSDISFNNQNNILKKTARNISFSGLSISSVNKIKQSGLWKFLNNKTLEKFLEMADASQTIFDAIFALGITCFLRPVAIMAQSNEKNKQKNKKAASQSISSGLIGYGFAKIIFSPIKNALDKMKKHPDYFARQAAKFLGSKKNAQTFTMLVNKSTEILTASARSAITIALIPIIDKYILNRLLGTQPTVKKDLQNPNYKYSIINFKNNSTNNKVFQSFAGGAKKCK